MFRNMVTKIGTITLAENSILALDLPRKDFLRELELRMTLVVTVTTKGPGVIKLLAPTPFIKRIELVADGKDVIKSIPAEAAFIKNWFQFGVWPNYTKPAIADAALTFYADFIVPLAMPRAIREIDTLLPTGRLSTLQLRLITGAYTDIFSTNPTTAAFTSGSVEVLAHQAVNISNKPYVFSIFREGMIEKQLSATSSGFQIDLPIGNTYRGFLIQTEADKIPVDTIVTGLASLKSGSTIFFSVPWYAMKGFNRLKHYLETPPSGLDAGWAYIDLCPEGRLVDAIASNKLSELNFVFDATLIGTTDYIRIYPDELIIPQVIRA